MSQMNMNDVLQQREQVSALADGQLQGGAFAAAIESVVADADARQSWHLYHLVGDVLRSGELAACGHDSEFVARVRRRLHDEVISPVPLVRMEDSARVVAPEGRPGPGLVAPVVANAAVFRWKLVAGLASLLAVTAVGWNAIGGSGSRPDGAQLAQATPPQGALAVQTVATMPSPGDAGAEGITVMLRDPLLDDLLAAHRQLGGASALQNPSGFLRNATFEGAGR
jgi:sigma-E factor negative regulatory protein RseA